MKGALILLLCVAAVIAQVVKVDWIQTAEFTSDRLTPQDPIYLFPGDVPADITLSINRSETFQTILGFGGAFTEAAAYVLSQLSPQVQQQVVDAYFGPEGQNYTLCRMHMNSCDFSVASYSYDDAVNDLGLEKFDTSHDEKWMLPMIKQILATTKNELKVYFTPWSPPAWMKSNGQMDGSYAPGLVDDAAVHKSWALFYSKYITYLKSQNIPVWGLTVQNEPENNATWESCLYTPQQEADFIKNYLGPQLAQDHPEIEIMIYDHNKGDMVTWAKGILSDPEAAQYVKGTAFHWYDPKPYFENVQEVHDMYPDKFVLNTEACNCPGVLVDDWSRGEAYAFDIMGDLNAWSVGWVDWNILLDQEGGPNHVGNFCDAPIFANLTTGEIHLQPPYFFMGHFTRYLPPGSVRIGWTQTAGSALQATAFQRPDGYIVLIVFNQTDKDISFAFADGKWKVLLTTPQHSIQTYTYLPANSVHNKMERMDSDLAVDGFLEEVGNNLLRAGTFRPLDEPAGSRNSHSPLQPSTSNDPAFDSSHFVEVEEVKNGGLGELRVKEGAPVSAMSVKEAKERKYTGHAKMTLVNGDIFEGEFRDGLKSGLGIYRYSNGSIYRGEYVKGQKNGYGTLTFANGDQYEGEFRGGKQHGRGKYSYSEGGNLYVGDWFEGLQSGIGVLSTITEAGIEKYEGEWLEGVQWGRGVYTYSNGDVYEGTFAAGYPQGHGVLNCRDGSVYDGKWANGLRNGRGSLIHADGSVFEGIFERGCKLKGVMTNTDGTSFEETWKEDEVVERTPLTADLPKKRSFFSRLKKELLGTSEKQLTHTSPTDSHRPSVTSISSVSARPFSSTPLQRVMTSPERVELGSYSVEPAAKIVVNRPPPSATRASLPHAVSFEPAQQHVTLVPSSPSGSAYKVLSVDSGSDLHARGGYDSARKRQSTSGDNSGVTSPVIDRMFSLQDVGQVFSPPSPAITPLTFKSQTASAEHIMISPPAIQSSQSASIQTKYTQVVSDLLAAKDELRRVKGKKRYMKAGNQDLEQQLATLKEECVQLREGVLNQNKRILIAMNAEPTDGQEPTLDSVAQAVSNMRKKLEDQIRSLHSEIFQLKEQLVTATNSALVKDADCQQMTKQVQKLERTGSQAALSATSLGKENAELSDRLTLTKRELDATRTELEATQHESADMAVRIRNLELANQQLTSQLRRMSEESDTLKSNMQSAESRLSVVEREKSVLVEMTNHARALLEEDLQRSRDRLNAARRDRQMEQDEWTKRELMMQAQLDAAHLSLEKSAEQSKAAFQEKISLQQKIALLEARLSLQD